MLSNIRSIVKPSRCFPRSVFLHEGDPTSHDRYSEAGSRRPAVSDPKPPRCPPPKRPFPSRSGPPRAPTDRGSRNGRGGGLKPLSSLLYLPGSPVPVEEGPPHPRSYRVSGISFFNPSFDRRHGKEKEKKGRL